MGFQLSLYMPIQVRPNVHLLQITVALANSMLESSVEPPHHAQLGLPVLPEHGSQVQTAILNEWLRSCDETHGCVSEGGINGNDTLPTRLLDIGSSSEPILRLVDRDVVESGRYIALSHCWGSMIDHHRFCTFNENLEEFRDHIDYERLPNTFKDAVRITRALNIRYLWIDFSASSKMTRMTGTPSPSEWRMSSAPRTAP